METAANQGGSRLPRPTSEGVEMVQTDCDQCQIEQDLFIRLCPTHKAAPFMLEQCKSALRHLGNPADIECAMVDLEAAIEKAEGHK